MNGLLAYGAYVPRHRLDRAGLKPAGKGARVIASYDEDATTLAVEAARRALPNGDRPGNLFFATTMPPYADKTNASAIHAALDLGHEGFAVDMVGSARSFTGALRAASSSGGLVCLGDMRTGRPGSADEREGADAGAALLFGDGEAIAEVLAEASTTAEFLDRWRTPGSLASSSWEERFGQESYLPLIRTAVASALERAGVEKADHVIVSCPHTRAGKAAARELGAEPSPAGYAGAADPGFQLAALLDRAGAGETILLVVAADGCDAAVLRTTEALPRRRAADPVAEQLERGREVDYTTYLNWRGLLDREPPRRPEPERPAGPPSARSESWKFAFVGSQCTNCGQVHVPPRRVCVECRHTDEMERVGLAGRAGKVATYTVDRLAFSPAPPIINTVVDFDGGGRYTLEVTDAMPEEVEIGAELELTFRKLYTVDGVHNYFWKARPS